MKGARKGKGPGVKQKKKKKRKEKIRWGKALTFEMTGAFEKLTKINFMA